MCDEMRRLNVKLLFGVDALHIVILKEIIDHRRIGHLCRYVHVLERVLLWWRGHRHCVVSRGYERHERIFNGSKVQFPRRVPAGGEA